MAEVDARPVGHDRGFILAHEGRLGIEGLPRDRILRNQGPVALEVEVGVLQQRLVLLQRAGGLLQGDLVGPRINHGQQITLLDELALGEGDLDELARDLGFNGHRRERRYGS